MSESFYLIVIHPLPCSPFIENFTLSFDVSIYTLYINLLNILIHVSDKFESSLQIFVNSLLLIVMTEEYSVSGIPNYSLSIYNKLRLKSENFSPF